MPGRTLRSPLGLRLLVLLAWTALVLVAGVARAADAPAPSASAAPVPDAVVHVHDRAVFTLKAARAGIPAADRARAASKALDTAAEAGEGPEARVEERDGVAVVFVGKTPIVTLGPEDATTGEPLHVFASNVAAHVEDGVRAEERRSSIASSLFDVSLIVFFGLCGFLLARRVGQFMDSARAWVKANPQRVPALRLGRIEVVHPNAIRGAITIALGLANLIVSLSIAYAWLGFSLSRFAATRGYAEKLTGVVLAPLGDLLGRVGSALPVVVVASIAALAVGVLVRFVSLFFESVSEGSTSVGWLPRELAAPTSVLARAGIIVAALVLAAPLLTGTDNGALSRLGIAVLLAIGLAATPVLACIIAGIPVVYGRRLAAGDYVEIGAHAGRVNAISLLTVTLEASDGSELRIPHLVGLVRATRVIGRVAPLSFDITIDPRQPQAHVRARLLALAEPFTTRGKVELVSLDGEGAHYRVSGCRIDGAGDLASTMADALRAENVALGRARPDRAP